MSLALLTKDPAAQLDYGFDWSVYIGSSGKTISASTWTIPDGLVSHGDSSSSTATSVILSGGTLAKAYNVVNLVTFSDGTIDQRSMTILIQKK
jgi:hypothetical protein